MLALALSGAALGCEPAPPSATPDGAVREFVERVNAFHGRDEDAQALYELLSDRAKENLQTRADRYGAASGKKIAPWAMLVPSRTILRFSPQLYQAQVVGKYALVDVVGVSPEAHAQVPCVLEEGMWRVDLVLPELPPVEHRPGLEP
ncbi:MAG: hypothetical protein RIF41_11290 [Polyangiaceae bacterium]